MKVFPSLCLSIASATSDLYCIYAGGGVNPRALPNNMCCPFTQTEGVKGTPYHAGIHGCCGVSLYDLQTHECCADVGFIYEIGVGAESVDQSSIMHSVDGNLGDDSVILSWNEIGAGYDYKLRLESMKDDNGDDVTEDDPAGMGTIGTGFTMITGVKKDITYTIEIVAVHCNGESSSPTEYSFKVASQSL